MLRALSYLHDPTDITAIVNVGDDLVLHGLTICPDIDSITYTLSGLNDEVRGWGLTDESWRVMGELGELGGENWFSLGDRDLATHLYRSERMSRGATKSDVTTEIATRRGVAVKLLPVTDDELSTVLDTEIGRLSFQQYFVQHHHSVAVSAIHFENADRARPTPQVVAALASASQIIIAPSNPLLSIDPILAVPGVREILIARREHVIAVSPFIGGAAIKGPADRLMNELGHGANNVALASYYKELIGTLVIDTLDAHESAAIEALGVRAHVVPTLMKDEATSRALAASVLR